MIYLRKPRNPDRLGLSDLAYAIKRIKGKKMSKGPKIKDWVKWYIRTEALKNRVEPRDSVAERIETYLEDKEPIPSRDTLNKMISSARNSNDSEDNPWSVSALADYDIPPEALPIVMKAWAKALADDDPLTIRQVKWIAHLCHIYKGETDISLEWLIAKASEYASREKAIKSIGTYPDKPQNMRWLWFGDVFLYLDCLDKSDKNDVALAKRLMAMYGPRTPHPESMVGLNNALTRVIYDGVMRVSIKVHTLWSSCALMVKLN